MEIGRCPSFPFERRSDDIKTRGHPLSAPKRRNMQEHRLLRLLVLAISAVQISMASYPNRLTVKYRFDAEHEDVYACPLSTVAGKRESCMPRSFATPSVASQFISGGHQTANCGVSSYCSAEGGWITKRGYRATGTAAHSLLSRLSDEWPYSPGFPSGLQYRILPNHSGIGAGSDNSKLPAWQQAGIYGLEFLAGELGCGISSFLGATLALRDLDMDTDLRNGAIVYSCGNILLTSTCTYFTGHLLEQKGRWWHAACGAGVGSLVCVSLTYLYARDYKSYRWWGSALMVPSSLVLPALGATIGFNLK
jgi:hypothetical protein